MQGATIRQGAYYRCTARTLAPGSARLADHLRTVNLREDVVVPAVNGWIGTLFGRDNVERTVAKLVGSRDVAIDDGQARAKERVKAATAKLRRYRAAIDAGVDPVALVEPMNEAQAERATAEAALANAPESAQGHGR
jgi:hypothetical protein